MKRSRSLSALLVAAVLGCVCGLPSGAAQVPAPPPPASASGTTTAAPAVAQQAAPVSSDSAQPAVNPAITPVPRPSPWWIARHQMLVKRAKSGNVGLLFVGDSITQNYEKSGPAPDQVFLPIWDEYFAPHKALNLGFSGDQTQNVLWRLQHGEVAGLAPKDIVLMIGTNNTVDHPNGTPPQTAEQVTAGIEAVVHELHARMPAAKITLIEILPSAVSKDKSAKDAAVNKAIASGYAHTPYIRLLDLAPLFMMNGSLNASLFYDPRLPSHRPPLHPDTEAQRSMAAAVDAALYP